MFTLVVLLYFGLCTYMGLIVSMRTLHTYINKKGSTTNLNMYMLYTVGCFLNARV